jgi:hypothetical protein
MQVSKGAGTCSGWTTKTAYCKGNQIKQEKGGVRYENCVLWRKMLCVAELKVF